MDPAIPASSRLWASPPSSFSVRLPAELAHPHAGRRGGAVDRGRRTMRRSLSLLLLMLIGACACGYRHSRPAIESGRDFPCRSAISLEGEPTAAEVVWLIGDPLERRTIDRVDVFRYSVRGKY